MTSFRKSLARLDSVLARCEDIDGCWVWAGGKDRQGYAVVHVGGTTKRGHRWVWEQFVGEIPNGLVLDHLCRNTSCVNPEHLDPVTVRVNTIRGRVPLVAGENGRRANLAKTHCPAGHPYAGNNIIRNGVRRNCRECGRSRSRAHWRRKNGHPVDGPSRRSKLTEEEVRVIRELAAARRPVAEIAAMFNVAKSTISRISTGEAWRHVS